MTAALRVLEERAPRFLGRSLTGLEATTFAKYMLLLKKWQRSQRLVGSADPGWIVENLFLDSLAFLAVLPRDIGTLLDVGSGAGIPGIPLKIVSPAMEITLVESRRRRASFLKTVVRELRLERVTVANARLEDVLPALAARFDAVVMRCAGKPADLVRLAFSALRPGGLIVVSGPPVELVLPGGEWVVVEKGLGPPRRFGVVRRA